MFDKIKKYNFKKSQQSFTNVSNSIQTRLKIETQHLFVKDVKIIQSLFKRENNKNETKRYNSNSSSNVNYEILIILKRKKKKRLLIKKKYQIVIARNKLF